MHSEPIYDKYNRIVKNTVLLYFRSFFTMLVSLYTSRIVLQALGVDDYGVYNVVAGFVSMFSLINGSMTVGGQRFLSFELGRDKPNVQKMFSLIFTVHVVLAVVAFLVLEIVGLWFFRNKMNIPVERIESAIFVFHCSVITFCLNTLSIPFNSAIVAYEKMSVFAYVGIFEVATKLVSAFVLLKLKCDCLVTYAVFIMLISVVIQVVYVFYCRFQLSECRLKFSYDRMMLKQLLNFCGWNTLGSSAAILNTQGINMLSNVFFGVVVNAARGIAAQVEGAITSFVNCFMMALNPQIMKSFASKNFLYLTSLIYSGTKAAFFLFLVIGIPVFVNTDFILCVWLGYFPEKTSLFVKLAIVFSLCQCLSQCLYSAMLATGKIKKYQIIVGGLSIMAFPIAWVLFTVGFGCEWGYGVVIFCSIVCLIARLKLLQNMVPYFEYLGYVRKTLIPILLSVIPIICVTMFVHSQFELVDWKTFIVESFFETLFNIVVIFFIGLSSSERKKVMNYIKKRKGHCV